MLNSGFRNNFMLNSGFRDNFMLNSGFRDNFMLNSSFRDNLILKFKAQVFATTADCKRKIPLHSTVYREFFASGKFGENDAWTVC